MESLSICLHHKPSAAQACTFVPATNISEKQSFTGLLVFLNGLVQPQASWTAVLEGLIQRRHDEHESCPAMLTYDRYGQGQSDVDPADAEPGKEPGYGHDVMDAVKDLHELVNHIHKEKNLPSPCPLLLVCNSTGCATARLYGQTYPGTIPGMLFLDSVMANSDFVSIFPDPDAPDFDPASLPEGVTADGLRETREKFRMMFHPSVKNPEGLDRRTLRKLLPDADGPVLEGFGGGGPLLTVVGHDSETFAEQSEARSMHTPKAITMHYTNRVWHRYNESLVRITTDGKSKGPIVASGSGHFIQKDNPELVVDEICQMLDRLNGRVA